jgi:hypothetical protein
VNKASIGLWRFVGLTLLVAGLLALAGWVPTRRLAGEGGIAAMLTGIGASLGVSLAAMVPLLRVAPDGRSRALLLSTLLRFVGALVCALVVVLGGWVLRGPFLLWLGLSYLVLLVADSAFALAALRG